ncbi:MAG: hypothetical protein MK080_01015 [Opitutales bacterium]|nr:hypothetical protein [Opitutales bacterium]NRA26183.1 hypothetical protein [Opitutales bacterium]
MNITNPGRRLLDILKYFKANAKQSGRGSLASYFSIDASSNEEVFAKVSKFYILIGDAERKIKSIDDPYRDKVLLCFVPLKKQFKSVNVDSSWQGQLNQISESDLGLLEIGADLLDKHFKENEIEKKQLDALIIDVNQVDSEIINSDVDPKVKGVIIDLLEGIRVSVSDYKVSGVEGLKRILAESFGRLSLDHEIVSVESEKESVKHFWDILSKINTMISSADLSYKLSSKTMDFLSGI